MLHFPLSKLSLYINAAAKMRLTGFSFSPICFSTEVSVA